MPAGPSGAGRGSDWCVRVLDPLSASESPGVLLPKSYMQLGGLRVFSAFMVMNYMDSKCLTTN